MTTKQWLLDLLDEFLAEVGEAKKNKRYPTQFCECEVAKSAAARRLVEQGPEEPQP